MIPPRWRRPARLAWLALVAVILVVHLAAITARFQELRQVCLAPEAICHAPPLPTRLTPTDVAALQATGLSPDGFAGLEAAKWLFFSSLWMVVGGLIFARKSDEWVTLVVAFFLVTFPTGWDGIAGALPRAYPLTGWLVAILQYGVSWGLPLFAALFPNGRLAPRWSRWLLLLTAIASVLGLLPPALLQASGWGALQLALSAVALLGLALAQVVRYRRHSNPAERARTRWVIFGICGSVALFSLLLVLWFTGGFRFGARGGPLSQYAPEIFYQVSLALIPLSIGVAILRNRLFDIDVVIRRTLVYSVLTAFLALAYFGSVVVLQNVFGALTGQRDSPLVTVLSTLVIAALFVPLRARVQAVIDQRFFRRKYDAVRTLAEFGASVRDETNLDQLTAHLTDVVDETMQPAALTLWIRPVDRIATDSPPRPV